MNRHLWLCAFFLTTPRLYAQTSSGDDRIEHISACWRQIDSDSSLQKVKMSSKEFYGEETSAGAASMVGSFKRDSLCKIDVSVGMSYGILREHYYFSGNQLLYVSETEDDFKDQAEKKDAVRSYEAQFYFDKDALIQKMAKGRRLMGQDDTHHYLELYHNGRYYAELLLKKYHSNTPSRPPAPAVRTT